MAKHSKKRIPQLSFTKNRGLGFYVSYGDPTTGSPRKHRFGMIPREQAVLAYTGMYRDWCSNSRSTRMEWCVVLT